MVDRKDSVSHPGTGSSEYASLADPSPIILRSKPHIYLDISRSIRRSMRFVIEVSTIGWNGSVSLFGNAVVETFRIISRTNWNYEFEVANLYI